MRAITKMAPPIPATVHTETTLAKAIMEPSYEKRRMQLGTAMELDILSQTHRKLECFNSEFKSQVRQVFFDPKEEGTELTTLIAVTSPNLASACYQRLFFEACPLISTTRIQYREVSSGLSG